MYNCFCDDSSNWGDHNTKCVRVQFGGLVQFDVSHFLENVVVKVQISGDTAVQLKRMGECLYKSFSQSSDNDKQQFLVICSEFRAGVSQDEWDKFAHTFVQECLHVRVQDEDQGQTMMRIATCFANFSYKDNESPRSSVCVVMDFPLEECTLDTSVGCNEKEWWSYSDFVEGSFLDIPLEDEIDEGSRGEEASVMTYRCSQLAEDQSCKKIPYTSICLHDVNSPSTDDEDCATSACGSGTYNEDPTTSDQGSGIRVIMADQPLSSYDKYSSSVISTYTLSLKELSERELVQESINNMA